MPYQAYEQLKERLSALGSVAVAFSGGVDSAFLLHAAQDALGARVLALTARAPVFPERELRAAAEFARARGIRQIVVDHNILAAVAFSQNPPDRCYLCKKSLMGALLEAARAEGIAHLAEGSNLDDGADYRPGMRAVAELGILSPLREAGMTKADIRLLSRQMGLPTWDKRAAACLASRFPYGERITPQRLAMVDRAEQCLLELGLGQVRVRFHGTLARIETDAQGIARLSAPEARAHVCRRFREIGFAYTALDLLGYRTGSMNETLEG